MRFNAIGIAVVLMVSMTLAGCTKKDDGNGGTDGALVEMKDFKFQPTEKTVAKGTKVTWKNRDSTFHTVTSNGSGPLKSGNVQAGQSFSYTFTEPGTYEYYCEPHSSGTPRMGMTAKIIVTA
jgi:plastocyanin